MAPTQILIIDSSSRDSTATSFREFGARVVVIPQSEFNHGGTRRLGTDLTAPSEFIIFLTQDAIPAHPEAFSKLLAAFANPTVGMAYGRQLPRRTARAIERHARMTNYPASETEIRNFEDRAKLGVKTTFCSNSFAAYRRSSLLDVGGFPQDAPFAEDQITAGKMLLKGWSVAYAGDACVTHSHGYSIAEEFRRYFDIGVFHARNSWLLESFGRAEGEGLRFIGSEMRYLLRHEPWSIAEAVAKTFAKYGAYRLGLVEHLFAPKIKAHLSMFPAYWQARSK
ncbi:glycosyl transferase family protein [Hydrocarboniphaga effusa AP103]|uniref:Glycosyl transferase family protein n=1 Tax=Hydrocarboniphaga effusa AP103 TaxID=1172194 RepID=I7ZJ75_9GAMM|nr:glycosyl transferase family protein [Hydrocarboniphaga effusa AP103]